MFYLVSVKAGTDLASHAGNFRGARISSLPTNACSTEDNMVSDQSTVFKLSVDRLNTTHKLVIV